MIPCLRRCLIRLPARVYFIFKYNNIRIYINLYKYIETDKDECYNNKKSIELFEYTKIYKFI